MKVSDTQISAITKGIDTGKVCNLNDDTGESVMMMNTQSLLRHALSRSHPFCNLHHCAHRQAWFTYKQEALEGFTVSN